MELTRLYPRWMVSVRNNVHTVVDLNCLIHFKLSFLYRARLVDLYGFDLVTSLSVNYLVWGYHQLYRFNLCSAGGDLQSLTSHYPAVNWFERETFEMLGQNFVGHPDLRRLLTDYGFRGYPLLKSFPVTGYYTCYYSERHKRVFQTAVDYSQEFRVNHNSLKFVD